MDRRRLLTGGLALTGAGATGCGSAQTGSIEAYAASMAATRAALSERPAINELVRFATLAANGHNTQPWRFRVREDRIEILPDPTRRTPVVDPDDHHLFASLGCAAENLAIAAAARGLRGELLFDPAGEGAVTFEFGSGSEERSDLLQAIRRRQSTRAEYDGRAVGPADLAALTSEARLAGVDLVLITERRRMEQALELVIAGNSAQMADAAFVREFKHWLRFNPRQALEAGDGLFSAASGNPVAPTWLARMLFDQAFRPGAENDKYARQVRSSAGLAVFVSQVADKDHWQRAGRASQRFALQATALGLKHAFINQPVEVASLRLALASLVGLPGRRPDLVMRFGYGPSLPFSPRRPVSAVMA